MTLLDLPDESLQPTKDHDWSDVIDHKEFICQSHAYRWLLASLRQHCQPFKTTIGPECTIGDLVRDHLRAQEPLQKLSRWKPPASTEMTVHVAWNPVHIAEVLKIKYPFSGLLEKVHCMTGATAEAQITTVAAYVRQTWPSTGETVLRLINELVSEPEGQECSCKVSER